MNNNYRPVTAVLINSGQDIIKEEIFSEQMLF